MAHGAVVWTTCFFCRTYSLVMIQIGTRQRCLNDEIASSNSLKFAQHLLGKIAKAQPVFETASAGQCYCSGSCYQVRCATVAMLDSAFKPTIALSSEAQTLVLLPGTFVLAHGVPLAFNLLPCKSSGMLTKLLRKLQLGET